MAVLWEEIGWVDLETYLRRDDRAILPVGSCEQHGRHLSFATDYLIPTEIAMRVSARTGVPVTPTLCFGMSVHHMEFPGTMSLSPDTFMAVFRDLVESLYRHGFRRVLVLNGHGGNIAPLTTALSTLADRHRDLRVKVGHWWQDPAVQAVLREAWGGVGGVYGESGRVDRHPRRTGAFRRPVPASAGGRGPYVRRGVFCRWPAHPTAGVLWKQPLCHRQRPGRGSCRRNATCHAGTGGRVR